MPKSIRRFDREQVRQGGVVSTPGGTPLTRLKVHTANIAAGQSGDAYLMLPSSVSPFFTETTVSVPLFTPADLSVDDEVWAEWHAMGKTFFVVNSAGGGGGGMVATTVNQIPARVGNSPGGSVNVQPKVIDGDTGEFVDYGGPVAVFSWVSTASADPADLDDEILWIWIELGPDGKWYFTAQDCVDA